MIITDICSMLRPRTTTAYTKTVKRRPRNDEGDRTPSHAHPALTTARPAQSSVHSVQPADTANQFELTMRAGSKFPGKFPRPSHPRPSQEIEHRPLTSSGHGEIPQAPRKKSSRRRSQPPFHLTRLDHRRN
jgi:hypothetical protein